MRGCCTYGEPAERVPKKNGPMTMCHIVRHFVTSSLTTHHDQPILTLFVATSQQHSHAKQLGPFSVDRGISHHECCYQGLLFVHAERYCVEQNIESCCTFDDRAATAAVATVQFSVVGRTHQQILHPRFDCIIQRHSLDCVGSRIDGESE